MFNRIYKIKCTKRIPIIGIRYRTVQYMRNISEGHALRVAYDRLWVVAHTSIKEIDYNEAHTK